MFSAFKSFLSRTRRIKKKNRNKRKLKSQFAFHKQKCISRNNELLDRDEVIEDTEGFRLKAYAPSHAYGVQPLGNLYFNPGSINCRDTGLGNLHALTEELVLEILGLLSGRDLGVLATVSKSFYVFTNHEPIWRNLVLENLSGGFRYTESWKSTYIGAYYPSFDVSNSAVQNFKVRDFYSDYLFQSWLCANLEMKSEWPVRDHIFRKKGISVEEFVKNFEQPNKPVWLEGCLDNWDALKKWHRDYLVHLCGDVKFSAGPVEMRLKD